MFEGLLYDKRTISAALIRLARVNWTFTPEMTTVLTDLATEFTRTEKEEDIGTILARVRLYVNTRIAGAAFSTEAETSTGIVGVLVGTSNAPRSGAVPI